MDAPSGSAHLRSVLLRGSRCVDLDGSGVAFRIVRVLRVSQRLF